ncbi:hypothetical protein PSQ19_15645 [Devosia algicola]|uniref:Uncharacterized protein n=1 Tax=Devosia algicola TaxID=3026418 RepID=A0ABY7YLL1_9HYPH|nr:hypothetical protein [Devosia algicola]WDR02087.1 hypothetical protein PSQ19_15645 [Devosia algicola]
MIARFIKILVLAAGIGIAVVSQRPHSGEMSNIARLLTDFGVDLPGLHMPAADNWVGGGALLVLSALVFWWTFWPRVQPHSVHSPARPQAQKSDAPAPTSPPPTMPATPLSEGASTPAQVATPTRVTPVNLGQPDMSIRELFLLLDPDLGSSAGSKAKAQKVGVHIARALADGSLRAWGKADAGGRVLHSIESGFWAKAEWTFWFLPADPRNRDLIHVASPDGQQQYRNVHVNRQAALGLLV